MCSIYNDHFYTRTEFICGSGYRVTLTHTGVCAHCLTHDRVDNLRACYRKTHPNRLFWRCWACNLMRDYQERVTKHAYDDGALIVRLKWTEREPELAKDGLAHSVQSYENAICSQQPTPRGYEIKVGFSDDELAFAVI